MTSPAPRKTEFGLLWSVALEQASRTTPGKASSLIAPSGPFNHPLMLLFRNNLYSMNPERNPLFFSILQRFYKSTVTSFNRSRLTISLY